MKWPKEPLSAHTTFKIGGPAKFWAQPNNYGELKSALAFAKESALSSLVIGAGSNILVSDEGFAGVVIKLGKPLFKHLECDGEYITAGSGAKLSELCKYAASHELSGMEHLFGIPGTVGGALAGNAGTGDRGICELAQELEVMDKEGNIKTIKRQDLKFGYRYSNLSELIILKAKLKLQKGDGPEIQNKMNETLENKKKTQEMSIPSAGCVFKNPNGYSAGELIDKCGLKGKRIGDAAVSQKHANYIVNMGRAKCSDVLSLIDEIKNKVKKEKGISLEEEIKIIK